MRTLIVMAIVFVLVILGCSQDHGRYAAQIAAMRAADPAKDADAAMAAGDYRFAGLMGFGQIVPGIIDGSRVPRNRVRIIPNTTDAVENSEHAELQRAAYDYAVQYNRRLNEALPRIPPMTRPATGPATQDTRGVGLPHSGQTPEVRAVRE